MEIDNRFQTPENVCDYMVSLVPTFARTILEPTPGIGNIVHSLEKVGRFKIIAADNFFTLQKSKYDCIVMNPPFSSEYAFGVPEDIKENGMRLGYYILTECMKQSDNVIALMPWFTILDSDVRFRTLKEYGLKSLTSLPIKTFQDARIQTVIIELNKGYKKDTLIRTL